MIDFPYHFNDTLPEDKFLLKGRQIRSARMPMGTTATSLKAEGRIGTDRVSVIGCVNHPSR
jgi:hypothetical protein